jgi:predicted MFS family arabinose efflux permease
LTATDTAHVERRRAQLLLRVGLVAGAIALTITCGVGAFGFLTGDRALGAYMVVAAVLVALALSGVVFIYRQAEREEPPALIR